MATQNVKRYPFSARKHAHDIEFACNRSFNQMYDARTAGDWNVAELMEQLHDQYEALLVSVLNTTRSDGVAWLTGPEIALAKEIVIWADNERHSRYRPNPNLK